MSVSTSPADTPRRLKIFVVENHPDTLQYMRMYLEGFGHTVLSATSVHEALAAVPESGCDVLISDIGLADGTGWDLLHALAERGQAPPYAIAMSGFGMNADLQRSEAAGFRHHLLKPFRPNELDAPLKEAADRLEAPPETGA